MATSQELIQYLKRSEGRNLKGLAHLKTVYRPVICPFDQLLDLIPPDKKVFDLGCGSGSLLSLINEFSKPRQLGGIEVSQNLVDNARQLLSASKVPVSINFYDGLTIPDEISEYDVITLIDVFHHIPKQIQVSFFDQLYKKMKEGSMLVFKDIDGSSPLVYVNKLHDMLLAGEIGNEWSAKKAAEMLRNCGFECSEISYRRMLVYPHYTILAKK